jgi:hypoxanthine phosphoribosyltransferase
MMIKKHIYDWTDVERMVTHIITEMYNDNYRPDYIVGLTRGGLVPAIMMSNRTGIPMYTLDVRLRDRDGLQIKTESNEWMPTDAFNGKNILIIDDINDSGATFNWITNDWASKYPDADIQKIWDNNVRFAVLTENMSSEFGNVRYQAHEVNKAEKDVWLVYPWE